MSTRRMAKVAEAIRETVSTIVLFGLKDPRVKNVTIARSRRTVRRLMEHEQKKTISRRGAESLERAAPATQNQGPQSVVLDRVSIHPLRLSVFECVLRMERCVFEASRSVLISSAGS